MARQLWVCVLVAVLIGTATADVYMHNMRGSNNRLDGDNTNVDNNKRLFDSQNNDKGGYNHGYMYYYAGSKLSLEWTNQHGAGANPNVHSEIIIQYLCDDNAPGVRDGSRDTTITLDRADDYTLGRHETANTYARCNVRGRNKGLYTSNQNPGNSALSTRQNPGATRFGFECTEERDYYPYWHPTDWKDLAILTSNVSRCDYYKKESQNVKAKGHCELTKAQQKSYDDAIKRGVTNFTGSGITIPSQAWESNNPTDCSTAGFMWKDSGKWGIKAPYCGPVPTSRDNHLGNAKSQNTGRGVYASMYNMTLPNIGSDTRRCVLRMRYNISTGDFDGWNTFADSNRQVFPSANNPQVTIYEGGSFPVTLTLQVDTSQYSRTFEDRSHVWELKPDQSGCRKIYNLNVRGKRGNIVQTYPAVEYDFVPERLHVRPDDCVHLQWTGSNSNPAGNAGEGVAGSDRSNFMQMLNHSSNYPANFSAITFLKSGKWGMSHNETLRYYAVANQPNNQAQLNDASPYFDGGLMKFAKGTYFYMSTRNNNFSNRSQKGAILSKEKDDGLNAAIIAGIVIFSVIVVAGAIIAWAVIGTRSPDSSLGTSWASFRDFFTGFVDH